MANGFVLGASTSEKLQMALRRNEKKVTGHEQEILEWLATNDNIVRVAKVAGIGLQNLSEEVSRRILELVKTGIAIPAITKPFFVSDHFEVNIGSNVKKTWKAGEVKISYVGDHFKSCFLVQTVGEQEGYVLSSYQPKKNAYDKAVRAELRASHETDLAGLFSLMRQQPEGGKGVLLTNGYVNVFYILDATGVSRAVRVHWSDWGWDVRARDLGLFQWSDERLVFASIG